MTGCFCVFPLQSKPGEDQAETIHPPTTSRASSYPDPARWARLSDEQEPGGTPFPARSRYWKHSASGGIPSPPKMACGHPVLLEHREARWVFTVLQTHTRGETCCCISAVLYKCLEISHSKHRRHLLLTHCSINQSSFKLFVTTLLGILKFPK